MFERFTDKARRVVVLAQEEARMFNHNYISTEHILLGLIREGEGVAARALESLGVSLEGARQQVEEIIGRGEQPPTPHIPFTPRAKKILDTSLTEAQGRGTNYVGTEHILLALSRDDGVATQMLDARGIGPDRVRREVTQLLPGRPGDMPPAGGSAAREDKETEELLVVGEIGQLRVEIERLRALLRAHGIDPGTGRPGD